MDSPHKVTSILLKFRRQGSHHEGNDYKERSLSTKNKQGGRRRPGVLAHSFHPSREIPEFLACQVVRPCLQNKTQNEKPENQKPAQGRHLCNTVL